MNAHHLAGVACAAELLERARMIFREVQVCASPLLRSIPIGAVFLSGTTFR